MRVRKVLFVLVLVLVSGAAMAQEPRHPQEPHRLDRASRVLPISVVLDGVQIPARFELPDQALTFFVMKGEDTNRVVYAFSSPVVAAEFLRRLKEDQAARTGVDSEAQALTACTWTNNYSWFNKVPGCSGSDFIILTYPNQYTDLDSFGWNNSISCVKAACNGLFTVIYSCRNFEMNRTPDCNDPDRWYISSGDIITDLNTVGMNNRTSSIRFE